MQYASLYAFHFLYFILNGVSTFLPKYYAEIGISDSGIGLLSSAPAIVAMCAAPVWGMLTDRFREKRYSIWIAAGLTAAVCVLLDRCEALPVLLPCVCLYSACAAGTMPAATSISMEYCSQSGKPYGPVRLIGTVGFQAGLLLIPLLFPRRLSGLYLSLAAASVLAGIAALGMPRVRGRQYAAKKVPLRELFRDRKLVALYAVILFATVSSQFYMSFFTKHLGDLGMDNGTVSLIQLISVFPELPFLWFCDRLKKRMTVWQWVWIGIAVNGVRWVLFSFMKGAAGLAVVQLCTAVTVMACFETIPAFWVSSHVREDMRSTALAMLNVTTFGVGRLLGGLLGGVLCEITGIPFMFGLFGCALLAGAAALFVPLKKLAGQEKGPIA